jgi:predicted cobalt transporter CbtA
MEATPAARVASRMPTNKWWAATVLAVGGLLTTWASAGEWTAALTGAAITLVTQRIVAYLVPNDDTPGGVPTKASSKPVKAT